MGSYLKENNVKVKAGTDINSIMWDMMSVILESALDKEMDEELGYTKYDYRNKNTDNSHNGHSSKTMPHQLWRILMSLKAVLAHALERAKEAGVNIKMTDTIRRILYGR